jgi:hypothetical protein
MHFSLEIELRIPWRRTRSNLSRTPVPDGPHRPACEARDLFLGEIILEQLIVWPDQILD